MAGPTPDSRTGEPPRLRLLHVGTFLSSFDRLLIAPLLLPIAVDLDVPVERVAAMATVYLFGYGLMQVVWGVVSDRLGRVRTMRLALAIAAVAGAATTLAPTIDSLVAARLVAGAAFAASVPGALIYIGDMVPLRERHGPLTDLMTATALGMASATVVGAALADLVSWRVAFAIPAVLVAVVVVAMRRLPEPPAVPRRALLAPLGSVLRSRWPLVVLGFAFVEGMLFLGILTYLPATLQAGGMGTTLSGVLAATYGVCVGLFAAVVKRLARRTSPARLIATGVATGIGAYGALVTDQGPAGVTVASVLLAASWAFTHSTMQKWATEVAPAARATVVSLFASSLFLGSSAWTALGAGYVAAGRFETYFALGLGAVVTLTIPMIWARHRYDAGAR